MTDVNRRHLLAAGVAGIAAAVVNKAVAQPAPATTRSSPPVPQNVVWHDVSEWGVEGRGFNDTEGFYDRLPVRAKGVVRDAIWKLGKNTAGMSTRFETDAAEIYVRYELLGGTLAMPHMAATGKSGFDVYAREGDKWRWAGTRRPEEVKYAGPLLTNLLPGRRLYQVNLPLYNGVKSLAIGVAADAFFAPVAPRKDKPLLFYGTSITQGGCASRPGLAFASILGRRLDRPVLNFGFSGNGLYEIEVGRFLVELDPAVFVIDCVGNSTVEQIKSRLSPLVRMVRERHAETPILLLDRPMFPNMDLVAAGEMDPVAKNRAQRDVYERLRSEGIGRLYYQESRDFIGEDGEGTVDGSHPNDLGMMRYADALEPPMRRILREIS